MTHRHRAPCTVFRRRGGTSVARFPRGRPEGVSPISPLRLIVIAVIAVGPRASAGWPRSPQTVAAAGKKVVIVVGPVGSSTSNYIYNAKTLAAQARSYGATVYEVYSPHATWARVRSVAQGANVFIYLGHGNGYPSPYGAFSKYSKDGLGLNTTDGSTRQHLLR